jgi:hypothetical protein
MNTLSQISTITSLVAEIGVCDELTLTLQGFIKTLQDLKKAVSNPAPKEEKEPEEERCEDAPKCGCCFDPPSYKVCCECGDERSTYDLTEDRYDNMWCDRCWNANWTECCECEEHIHQSDDEWVEATFDTPYGKTITPYCFECFKKESTDYDFHNKRCVFVAMGELTEEELAEFRNPLELNWCVKCGDDPSKGAEYRNYCQECWFQHGDCEGEDEEDEDEDEDEEKEN